MFLTIILIIIVRIRVLLILISENVSRKERF